jgi:hypothetical protein
MLARDKKSRDKSPAKRLFSLSLNDLPITKALALIGKKPLLAPTINEVPGLLRHRQHRRPRTIWDASTY